MSKTTCKQIIWRAWQEEFIRQAVIKLSADSNFLLYASTGAGKTKPSLEIARSLLSSGRVRRLVIVVPGAYHVTQWQSAASEFGWDLYQPEPLNYGNKKAFSEPPDVFAICVTYQQVFGRPEYHAERCKVPTLVIFDEIHHSGDGCGWGEKVKEAFGQAVARLGLTGTPFRSDGTTIPFINYTEDGACIPDFKYTFVEALVDGVCRPVSFPSYDGTVKWYHKGEIYEHRIYDVIPENQQSARLKTALDPGMSWVRTWLHEAHSKLIALRYNGHPTAGGLIKTIDIKHALRFAAVLKEIMGQEPVLVTSEALSDGKSDGDFAKKTCDTIIDEFSRSNAPWIIAVGMITEGVDIPRLRVGVWATNVTAPLSFFQFVGRFVRQLPGLGDDYWSYVFIPNEPSIVKLAQDVIRDCNYATAQLLEEVDDEDERDDEGNDQRKEGPTPPPESPIPISAEDTSLGQVIMGEEVYEGSYYTFATNIGAQTRTPTEKVIEILKLASGSNFPTAPAVEASFAPSKTERKTLRSDVIRRLVGAVVNRKLVDLSRYPQSKPYMAVHQQWKDLGGSGAKEATVIDLRAKTSWLKEWLATGKMPPRRKEWYESES